MIQNEMMAATEASDDHQYVVLIAEKKSINDCDMEVEKSKELNASVSETKCAGYLALLGKRTQGMAQIDQTVAGVASRHAQRTKQSARGCQAQPPRSCHRSPRSQRSSRVRAQARRQPPRPTPQPCSMTATATSSSLAWTLPRTPSLRQHLCLPSRSQ